MGRLAEKQNKADILVVGAGLAGVSAAIAAARHGARVTLIEKESVPGGTAVGLRHRFLCGLFPNSANQPRKYLNPGLSEEFGERLSPGAKPVRMGKVWLFPYDPERLPIVLDDFLTREKNIRVLYGSKISACLYRQGRLESVRYSHKGQHCQLAADVFIDAGAGILLQKCGAAQSTALAQRQMSGFAIELGGVQWDDVLPIQVPYELFQAVKRGALPLYARWTAISAGEEKDRGYLKLSLPATATLPFAKKVSAAVVRTLLRELPAFRLAKITWQSPAVFLRDGDRLQGQYVLTDNDVLAGKKFSDGIMRGAWPEEFWDPKRGPTYKYCNADYYELPARSLLSRDVSNLLSAGRSVSAEPGALASLRVGGLCLATGEAAGWAATAALSGRVKV